MSDDEFHDFSDVTGKTPGRKAGRRGAPTPHVPQQPAAAAPATAPATRPERSPSSSTGSPYLSPLSSLPLGSGSEDASAGKLVDTIDFEGIPPPEADSLDMSSVIDQTFNVTSRQFFELFLADRAVFPFAEFHHLRGDKDCHTTPWRPLRASDSPEAAAVLAADPRLTTGTIERRMKTQLKVDSAFSRLHKVQRLVPLSDGFLMLSRGITPDVIFGSQFAVTDIWRLRDVPGARQCRLEIQLGGAFPDPGWAVRMLMSVITSRIKTEGQEMWLKWAEVAKLRVGKLAHELTSAAAAAGEGEETQPAESAGGAGPGGAAKTKVSASASGAGTAASPSSTGAATSAATGTGSGSVSGGDDSDPAVRTAAADTVPTSSLAASMGGCVLPEDDPAMEGLSDVEEARQRTLQRLKAIELTSGAVGDDERQQQVLFIQAQVKAQQAAISAREREKRVLKEQLAAQEAKKRELAAQRRAAAAAAAGAGATSSRAIDQLRLSAAGGAAAGASAGAAVGTGGGLGSDDDDDDEEEEESDTDADDVAQMGPEEFARHERRVLRRAKARRRNRRRQIKAGVLPADTPLPAAGKPSAAAGSAGLGVPASPVLLADASASATPETTPEGASGGRANPNNPMTMAQIAAQEAKIQADLEAQNNRMCARQCRPQEGSCVVM